MLKFWIADFIVRFGSWICERGVDFAGYGYVNVNFEVTEQSNKKFVRLICNIVGVFVLVPLFWVFIVILFACTPGM